jgi:hypothetical protein
MQAIDGFALAVHAGAYESWPDRTRLFFNCRDTGTALPGYRIAAQYRYADGYLLITAYDCPYEEANEFLLLDSSFRMLARRSLGEPYGTYLLHAHWPVAENALRLHYHDALFYTLAVRSDVLWLARRRRLQLTRFPNPERDPDAAASIADLNRRIKQVR